MFEVGQWVKVKRVHEDGAAITWRFTIGFVGIIELYDDLREWYWVYVPANGKSWRFHHDELEAVHDAG